MNRQHTLKAAFHTLGCKTNHYETDAVAQRFQQAGFIPVGFDEHADVYVLNTCTVTAEADRKSRQHLRRARTMNPDAIVVALGCHAQLNADDTLADVVIGTQGKLGAVEQVLGLLVEKGRIGPVDRLGRMDRPGDQDHRPSASGPWTHVSGPLKDAGEFDEYGPVSQQSETRAYIKIEDGCDNFCAYCAIPLARGRVRSRKPENVLVEAVGLAAQGYREVVLTGIHICSYGSDRGQTSEALPELAARIGRIKGIERIRFGSLEPQSITPVFARKAREVPGLCPHFHISLQSGSDDVLRRMGRRYDTARFRQSVSLLREQFPEASFTTDVMVGFPGEDEAMHRQSLDFVREIGFSRLHVFRYSKRDKTAAARMADQVPKDVAIQRSTDMQALGDELAGRYHSLLVGQAQSVLIEQILKDNRATGYTRTYVPVLVEDAAGLAVNQTVDLVPYRSDHEFLHVRHAKHPDSC